MKNLLKVFLANASIICCLCLSGCDESVSMAYEEATSGIVLNKDLNKTPEENVDLLLTSVGIEAESVMIYGKGGNKCGCTKGEKSCYCMLKNAGTSDHHCGGMEDGACTKEKYIVVQVQETDVEKLNSIGFNKVE